MTKLLSSHWLNGAVYDFSLKVDALVEFQTILSKINE